MSTLTGRLSAIASIAGRIPSGSTVNFSDESPETVFGSSTFSLALMKDTLKPETYASVVNTIKDGKKLPETAADEVADAMRRWAVSKGATHYAHVFYPLTGITAEKHDSFYDPGSYSNEAISKFKGKTLIQGEPDASSFPNGGIRATHRARGYTAWDVTSPAYVLESGNGTTLCIPTSFVSWTGEALDTKTPLLRSMQALDTQARRILKLFGHEKIAHVSATAGPEQEYFLIDKTFFYSRPDLLAAGRTLFGAPPPKGQEFEDHYFGVIPERVIAFMYEVDRELYKLGIPSKTRHNEVAPGQFEIAPLFESANVAADHQQMTMSVLKKVADKHGLACILHEKPFAGVNGSGKHVNWSLGNSTQGNLLDPGDTPHENAQFLVFAGAVIRAVSKYAPLLRSVVASAGNDHRLGANEAPPAIISVYLGDQLADVFDQIKAGGVTTSKQRGTLNIGVDVLPDLPKDAGDRNRTSPFAFTGNRFEFRAVGSNQTISPALSALNTIMTDSLDYIASRLEGAPNLNVAIQNVLKEIVDEHGSVIFNGNGYSEEWHAEAAVRGLANLKTATDALPEMAGHNVIEVFEKYGVLSEAELHSRYEVAVEQYVKQVNVEANLVAEIAQTKIFPVASGYATTLADSAAKLKAAGVSSSISTLEKVAALVTELETDIAFLKEAHSAASEISDWTFKVLPAMLKTRKTVDALEGLVPDDSWPLPTYQEMLFIK
ncbi:MAG: glutamine synthetase catalytic region [Chthoniobacteraceae bacterium]|nr:glutamine synthetase catalytic region [Chthoniobacteraceae bacterium]